MRLGLCVISRRSDELLELVELPEETTGDTSAFQVSCLFERTPETNRKKRWDCSEEGDVPSLCILLAKGLGPMLGPRAESW